MRTSLPYQYRGNLSLALEAERDARRLTLTEWTRYMECNARANLAYPKLRDTVDHRYSITLEERQP